MKSHQYPYPKLAVTHAGVFHADDVFAFAFLRKINPEIKLKRVIKVEEKDHNDPNTVVFDIGGGLFDHHTKETMEWRDPESTIYPYASFGKVVRGYGDYVFDSEAIMNLFDSMLVTGIDMHDCGSKTIFGKPYHNDISMAVNAMNPTWLMQKQLEDDGEDTSNFFNIFFLQASGIADAIIDAYIHKAIAINMSNVIVDEAIQARRDGENFIVLPYYVNYTARTVLMTEDVKWAIYPSKRGGWQIYSVVDHGKNRDLLSDDDIKELSKNPNCTFVHPGGFTAVFKTKESAIAYLKER